MEAPKTPDDRADNGGPYTLGNEGALTDVGLELAPSPVDVVGESGGR